MPVPIVYRSGGEGAIASYDFYDLAAKTGYKTFYGTQAIDDTALSGAKVFTTSSAFYSDVETSELGGSSPTRCSKLDFDLTFAVQTILKGVATLNIPSLLNTNINTTIRFNIISSLHKISGATDTIIGAETIKSHTETVTGGTPSWAIDNISFDIASTVFKSGDKLRLTLSGANFDFDFAPSCTWKICHDPKNRGTTATVLSEQLALNLPFRIDL